MRLFVFLLCCSATMFTACKKESNKPVAKELLSTDIKNGYPQDAENLSGIFILRSEIYGSLITNYCYVKLADPPRNLYEFSGNVNAGSVKFNEYFALSNGPQYFSNFLTHGVPDSIVWTFEGVKGFEGFRVKSKRLQAFIPKDAIPDTFWVNNPVTIHLPQRSLDFDSLTAFISIDTLTVHSKSHSGSSRLEFVFNDIPPINKFCTVFITTNNFSHFYRNGKLFVIYNKFVHHKYVRVIRP